MFLTKKKALLSSLLMIISGFASLQADEAKITPQFLEEAKKNTRWKIAFATAEHEQIVFMNISPLTNPSNEIGEEVHPFDQVILIVEGEGNAVLSGKVTPVKEGDMIFIPQGISHNVVNTHKQKALKLISFYSDRDIPKGASYEKKSDEKQP